MAQDIIDGAGLSPNTSPRFLLASFAGSDHGAGGFSPQMLFSQGITHGDLRQYIDTFVPIFQRARLMPTLIISVF